MVAVSTAGEQSSQQILNSLTPNWTYNVGQSNRCGAGKQLKEVFKPLLPKADTNHGFPLLKGTVESSLAVRVLPHDQAASAVVSKGALG